MSPLAPTSACAAQSNTKSHRLLASVANGAHERLGGLKSGQKRAKSSTKSHRLLAGVATGADERLGGLKSGLCTRAGVGVSLVCLELGVVGELDIHCTGGRDTVRKPFVARPDN